MWSWNSHYIQLRKHTFVFSFGLLKLVRVNIKIYFIIHEFFFVNTRLYLLFFIEYISTKIKRKTKLSIFFTVWLKMLTYFTKLNKTFDTVTNLNLELLFKIRFVKVLLQKFSNELRYIINKLYFFSNLICSILLLCIYKIIIKTLCRNKTIQNCITFFFG